MSVISSVSSSIALSHRCQIQNFRTGEFYYVSPLLTIKAGMSFVIKSTVHTLSSPLSIPRDK